MCDCVDTMNRRRRSSRQISAVPWLDANSTVIHRSSRTSEPSLVATRTNTPGIHTGAADRRRFPAGGPPLEQISSRASGNAPRVAPYFSSHNFSWSLYPIRLLSFSCPSSSPPRPSTVSVERRILRTLGIPRGRHGQTHQLLLFRRRVFQALHPLHRAPTAQKYGVHWPLRV